MLWNDRWPCPDRSDALGDFAVADLGQVFFDMPVLVQQQVPDHKNSGVNNLPNFDSAASVPIEVRCCSPSARSPTSLS